METTPSEPQSDNRSRITDYRSRITDYGLRITDYGSRIAPPHQYRIALVLILLLATGLRFYRLDAQSFWNDEGNSARLSERPIPAIIEGTASDIHPPLYYLILRGWRELVGETEFGLRSFSAFVGVGIVALTFALGKELEERARARGKRAPLALALSSSLLTAVSPPLIYYSQETRMYSLLAFWAVLTTWLLFTIHNSQFTIHNSLFYILAAAAGLYTHYFFPAVLLAHSLLILIWLLTKRGASNLSLFRRFIRWASIMLVVLLIYLPWLPVFINQAGGRPNEARQSFLSFVTNAGRWLAFGATMETETAVPYLIAAVLLLGMGALMRNWTAVILLVVPILFMYAVGTTQPQFFKFMIVSVPFLCLLMAMGVWRLEIGDWRLEDRWLISSLQSLVSSLLFLAVLAGSGRSLHNLYFNPAYARADYRGMAARIEAEAHPNAGIVLDAPNQWEAFTYYHRSGAPVYPIPMGRPLPDKINAELTEIAAKHDRLYAIFWGEAQRDPERLVERWLDEHAFKAADEWVSDVRFVTYAVPSEAADEMETAVNLLFGDAITLNGYTLASDHLTPGDIVQITLFWETAVPLQTRYKIFLHLVNKNGDIIAQRDSEPGGGLNLTVNWEPGQPVSDNHGVLIPADTPPGAYQLLLGLYDAADSTARLPIQTSAGIVDVLPLLTIQIK